MKIYSIRHVDAKKPLGVSIFSNGDADFSNDVGAMFELDGDYPIYNVPEYSIAEKALHHDPQWYNASLEHPQWPQKFNPLDYEVFEINF